MLETKLAPDVAYILNMYTFCECRVGINFGFAWNNTKQELELLVYLLLISHADSFLGLFCGTLMEIAYEKKLVNNFEFDRNFQKIVNCMKTVKKSVIT